MALFRPEKIGAFFVDFPGKIFVQYAKVYYICSTEKQTEMKVELTEKEWDLIESIRNYHKAYPNGNEEQEWYITTLLQELLDRN